MGLPVVARIAGNDEWLAAAETRANAVLSATVGRFSTTMARVGLALIAVTRGDLSAAEEQYTALVSVTGIMVFYIGTDRVLGLLSVTMGRLDQATSHFEDALAVCRKAGYRPELAWTCCDYADTLLQRNNTGDCEKTMSLLHESLAISSELGMRPLMERVLALQDRVKSQPVQAAAYPGGLTRREAEVLRLVALGKSNPEIAEELIISLNTVTRHLTNIYSKISVSNRAEAAVYAAQHNLL